jgi:ACS family tartrate transporter-like MFS transporter
MSMPTTSALDRARRKAYGRLLPLLFLCYMLAYVDRVNVGYAKLTMGKDLKGFDEAIFGLGMGLCFSIGYVLLEIPGTVLVEKWSARKWISRIMISWGIIAACTALVKTPWHFFLVRFLLGTAEAGFFPGVIVYLTHWFPKRDRSQALAWFFIATPVSQIVSPYLSSQLLVIGTEGVPPVMGLNGWQWVFIAWGIPAVLLGFVVLFWLTDRPRQARWLEPDEREALEAELAREKAQYGEAHHMTLLEGLRHPKVLLLTAAYFFVVTGNYGVEYFMPSIFDAWYKVNIKNVALLVTIPPIGSLIGQLLIARSSDRTGERRLHASLPILIGAAALACTLLTRSSLWLTVAMFTLTMTGLKAYLPAFWALPSLFLTSTAAAGSIGLINSVGNLGQAIGPGVMGFVKKFTGSFEGGLIFLAVSMVASAVIILTLGLGRREADPAKARATVEPLAEDALIEPA